jgi:cytochrome b subunit of formate dehydrogenase
VNQVIPPADDRASSNRIARHAGFDRLLHWLTAAAVLILLGTAFLPILGIDFAWVTVHWVAGIVLIAVVLAHVVRELFRRNLRAVWIDGRDLRDAFATARMTLRIGDARPGKPGKYSFAQKLIHFAFTVVILVTIVTGAMMMVKIDTPWWRRNLYWLTDASWGIVYVLHGLAALLLVTMVIAHIYFALRPEKRQFLRSMTLGWITRDEYRDQHDPNRWQVNE